MNGGASNQLVPALSAHGAGGALMEESRIQTNAPDWVGRGIRRFEDLRLLTGKGSFVDDISPPGCLHLHFVRSSHARGRIRRIELSNARSLPGVIAIYTGQELASLGGLKCNPMFGDIPDSALLAIDAVSAVGQPIAAVIAKTPSEARSAAESVLIDIEAGAPAAGNSTEVFRKCWVHGDVDAAFASADHVVKLQFNHARLAPAPLEPRVALAEFDNGTKTLTAWLSTQTPHRARADLARMLDFPIEQIRVVAPNVGGSFGSKASLYPEDVVVTWAALQLGRPVKWCATRSEDFLSATQGRGSHSAGEMALAADGRILGLRANFAFPLGHWLPYSATIPAWNAGRCLPGPYKVDGVQIEVHGRLGNTAALGIYRGAGRPEAAMLMERLIEEAARKLDIDPNELRRRNIISVHAFPYRTPTGQTFDSGNYEELLDHSCRLAGYRELLATRDRRRAAKEVCGIGTALYVEPCGQGWESGQIKLSPEGQIIAATGSTSQGQGRETTFAQIVADALAVDPVTVTVQHGDTALTPPGVGALASRSTAIGGSALLQAAEAFREKARALAARLLQSNVESVDLTLGGFRRCGGGGGFVSWKSIASAALAESGSDGLGFALETSIVFHAKGEAWSSGCCIATVSIDRETGALSLDKIFWTDDAGLVVNPLLAKGQLLGGLAQGLGEALLERIVYDENGELLTGSFSDYAMPRATHIPNVVLESIETGSPFNELGAKGVGEAGCIGVPAAVVNAVLDALSPFGVKNVEMPLTSEKLWRLMQAPEAPQRPRRNRNRRSSTEQAAANPMKIDVI
jgi:carbon-monoxide dehydrogenase large subunit